MVYEGKSVSGTSSFHGDMENDDVWCLTPGQAKEQAECIFSSHMTRLVLCTTTITGLVAGLPLRGIIHIMGEDVAPQLPNN